MLTIKGTLKKKYKPIIWQTGWSGSWVNRFVVEVDKGYCGTEPSLYSPITYEELQFEYYIHADDYSGEPLRDGDLNNCLIGDEIEVQFRIVNFHNSSQPNRKDKRAFVLEVHGITKI